MGVWDWHVHTAIFKIDNRQGPTVQHRESTQYFVITYKGKESEKNMYICITESLCCTPETNTTL